MQQKTCFMGLVSPKIYTHMFMQQISNWISKLAADLLHEAALADSRPMKQVFCCMVQICLMSCCVCVSIIVAAKLLHL